jgi:hypothetical protein
MIVNGLFLYVAYGLVAIAWIPLWIAPGTRLFNWWLAGVIIPCVLSIMFTFLLLTGWDQPLNQSFIFTLLSRFMTFPGVEQMMHEQPRLLDATWVDNLTTGMMAGAWITRRAQRTRLARPLLLLCQLLVFAMAPMGVLLYFIIEAARGKLGEPAGQVVA